MKQIIGQVEVVRFLTLDDIEVKARIDTGAKTSCISARAELDENGRLKVKFLLGKKSQTILFDDYSTTVVTSSNGMSQRRYVIKLPILIAQRRIRARFTLADRSSQVYPVLIGRNILLKKFIVDVASGSIDSEAEKARTAELRKNLTEEEI